MLLCTGISNREKILYAYKAPVESRIWGINMQMISDSSQIALVTHQILGEFYQPNAQS